MRVKERNKFLLGKIEELKREHPFWGYRKVWAYLKYREALHVNKKRIYRLMKENNLLVTKETKLKAKRGKFPYRAKPKPASYNNPKGNADTERVLRTLKEDLLWIKEFTSYEKLNRDLETWIDNYNRVYPHFSLKLKTPLQYKEAFGKSQTNQKEQTRTWKTQQIPA
jgi:transposase InsO family protein